MERITRNVRDIDAAHRAALEHVLGQRLHDDQQVIVSVVNLDASAPKSEMPAQRQAVLPDWCNVYEGLTDAEIDDIEASIVRAPGGRTLD